MRLDVLWEMPAAMLVMGYLLGSLPFGVILMRIAGAGDPRSIGSGNIGATNVLRSGRKGLAAATLLFDLLKGAVAVLIARSISPDDAALAGVGAFFGHLYPVWLKFRGGKGVATLAGIWLALAWPVGLAFAFSWVVGLAASRISSLGAIAAAIVSPIAVVVLGFMEFLPLAIALSLLLLWKHRANIARLVWGQEPRIGAPKVEASPNDG